MLRFLLLIVFFAFVIIADGQYTYPSYRQYTLRDGLSQMQVTGLIQDSRGYIWIGTKNGLNCFDGEKFVNFKKQDGLPDNYVISLTEDSNGNMWVSTRTGLVWYDGKIMNKLNFVINGYIFLTSSPDGKVWYAGRDNQDNTLFGYVENAKNNNLSDILPVKKGNLNIKYARKANAVILTDFVKIFEFRNNTIRQIATTNNEYALLENESTVAVLEYTAEDKTNIGLLEYRDGEMVQLGQNADNEYTLIHPPTEMFINVHPNSRLLLKIDKNGIEQTQFDDKTLTSCLIDKDSTLWLGTEEGLLKYNNQGFETYKREYLPVVWSMVEDNKQNIWFASYSYGIRKFDGNKITEFRPDNFNADFQGFNFQAQTNGQGMMYFPNNFGILYTDGKITGHIGEFTSLAAFYDLQSGLLYNGCHRFVEVYDRNHRLVNVIDKNKGLEFKGFISSFGRDSCGFIWFGGYTGLSRFNPENGSITNYNIENQLLKSDGVLSIFTDYSGRTWFGGTDGLLWFDQNSGTIQKLHADEIQGAVSFVTAIDSSWIIFGQSEGIYLMNLPEYYSTGKIVLHFFNEHNGFLGIDPGQNGAIVDSKGNIWMTTSTEVVKLDPKKLKLQKYFSAVRFFGFNGEQLAFSEEIVELPQNERSAIFTFDAICFNRPNQVQYSWKLSTDTVWSAWKEENYAVVANLPDGESEIMLRARVPGLPGTLAAASLMVKIRVAIWKQPWFFPTMFGLFALLSLLVFILFLRTRAQMMLAARQSKVFQVQAIQSQMNPHFIFNVLASFQTMILSLQTEKANQYLVKLAKLIRGFLDASSGSSNLQNKINAEQVQNLQKELELISGFVEFQQLIYPDKFEYILKIDEGIDLEKETIPPMILQPFVENAIRHGLLLKNGNGTLKIAITKLEQMGLRITIEDNGVGIEKAGQLLTNSPFRYESKGTMLTLNRIKLLNELGYHITIQTDSSDEGTKIEITILNHEQRN